MFISSNFVVLGILILSEVKTLVSEPLRIGAFNIKIFGQTKVGKEEVVNNLAKILERYDLVLIQEIRDKSGTAIQELLDALNHFSSEYYAMVISGRVGRTSSKEQYAYFYKPELLTAQDEYEYDDGDEDLDEDTFEREPYIVRFKSKKTLVKDFAIVGIHTKPTRAYEEIDSLVDVYDDIVRRWKLEDVVIAGDFNAGCTYVTDWSGNRLKEDDRFLWLLDDDVDTNVATSQCAYDRFVIAGQKLKDTIKPCSANVFYFSAIYGLDLEMTNDVSDHFPIEFQLLEDSGYTEEVRLLELLLDNWEY